MDKELVEIPSGANIEDVANLLEKNGFMRMSTAANRISLNKGYTRYGFADKVYHIYLRFFGDNDGKRQQFLELECEVQFGEGGERKGTAFGEVHGNRNYIEPQAQGQAVSGLRPPAPSYGRLQLKGT